MNATVSLTELAAAWRATKAAEQQLTAHRLEIEAQIVAALPVHEGTSKTELPDGARLCVAFGINRKVDTDKLRELWPTLPERAQAAFRWKAEVKEREFKALLEFAPEAETRLVASVIETKPAKPAITITTTEPTP